MKTTSQNYINHIALVLDASTSMRYLSEQVIIVADQQIAHLAKRSKELDQETRITVYTFNDTVKCVFYDKDVLRLPTLKEHYRANGNTALIDATLKALDDLAKTPELYGDHSFLVYVLTDGEENVSSQTPPALKRRLESLPNHWTVAGFVPSARGLHEAKQFGFPAGNLEVWNTTVDGTQEVGHRISQVTDSYMTARAVGVRGSRNLFTPDVSNLTAKTMTDAVVNGLRKLTPGQFRRLWVSSDTPIATFVEHETGRPYVLGEGFYQLTKPVAVQAQKKVAIYEKGAHTVYVGDAARKLLGLPDYEVKLAPDVHPKYDIFVQSTSVNRKLIGGTNMLVISQSVQ